LPLYEYECQKCRARHERIEKLSGPHLKKCPTCGGKTERMASSPAILFKGSGWYVTDYGGKSSTGDSSKSEKSDSKETRESKEGKESKDSKDSKSDSSSKDSRPAKKS